MVANRKHWFKIQRLPTQCEPIVLNNIVKFKLRRSIFVPYSKLLHFWGKEVYLHSYVLEVNYVGSYRKYTTKNKIRIKYVQHHVRGETADGSASNTSSIHTHISFKNLNNIFILYEPWDADISNETRFPIGSFMEFDRFFCSKEGNTIKIQIKKRTGTYYFFSYTY